MLVKERVLLCSSKKGCIPTLQNLYSTIPRETRIHMQNVGRYADILFRAVCNYDKNMVYSQMGEEFAQYSKDVFMMHDIGRHYIPVSILNKASKLTEEEIQIIKNHTIDAAKAMESVYEEPYPKAVMEQLLQIALYHHERYDGITSWKSYKKR